MVNINGVEWGIYLVSPFHSVLRRSDGSYVLGCCDNLTQNIYINDDLDNYYIKKVLCHEIVHAAIFSYRVDLTVEQEEIVADLIATYGSEIIQITNKVFKKYKEQN